MCVCVRSATTLYTSYTQSLPKELGIGAQFGGKWPAARGIARVFATQSWLFGARYFLHDVRVVRLPRHGASAVNYMIAIPWMNKEHALSTSSDALVTNQGTWLESAWFGFSGASCPVGVGVSCSADRQAKAAWCRMSFPSDGVRLAETPQLNSACIIKLLRPNTIHVQAKITEEGVFLEKLETDPAK